MNKIERLLLLLLYVLFLIYILILSFKSNDPDSRSCLVGSAPTHLVIIRLYRPCRRLIPLWR